MDLLLSILLFVGFATAFLFVNLTVGKLLRPKVPNLEKSQTYECGEATIGSSWVQFDLRFYIVALVFLIFDVEVALFYPWAAAFGSAETTGPSVGETAFAFRQAALIEVLVFLGILSVGFAYLWQFGYLDWVRTAVTRGVQTRSQTDLSKLARRDPVDPMDEPVIDRL